MHGNMRTFLLMAAMTALLMGMGWLIGGQGGAVLALVFAGVGNIWAWWNSDKAVLRQQGTERPGSSPLANEHRRGRFLCAGCANALYASAAKYDSGTGWPSFRQPLPGAVGTSTDFKLGYPRTAVHCADCGGHLGHVFDDGPPPTGKRYCMNGLAMTFRPA